MGLFLGGVRPIEQSFLPAFNLVNFFYAGNARGRQPPRMSRGGLGRPQASPASLEKAEKKAGKIFKKKKNEKKKQILKMF